MKKLLTLLLPQFLSGCAVYYWAFDPVPEKAYAVARGDKVAKFKMRFDDVSNAYVCFDRLYDVLSDRFGPIEIRRRKESAKFFSPERFCRWPQTDEHLGVDLYVEDWTKHNDPRFWSGGIVLDIYMRDFRKQDRETKARLIKRYGEEGAKKHLDTNGDLLP